MDQLVALRESGRTADPDESVFEQAEQQLLDAIANHEDTSVSRLGIYRSHRVALRMAAFVAVAAACVLLATSFVGTPAKQAIPNALSSWHVVDSLGLSGQAFAPVGGESPESTDVSCPTTSDCYLLSSSNSGETLEHASHDAGQTWSTLPLPTGVSGTTNISCWNGTSCSIGGSVSNSSGDVLLTTSDSGEHWSEVSVPMSPVTGIDSALDSSIGNRQGTLFQLKCFSMTTCVAFGEVPSDQPELPLNQGNGAVSRWVFVKTLDGGQTWSRFVFPWSANPNGSPGHSNLQSGPFTCATESDCTGLVNVMSALGSNSQVMSTLAWRTTDGGTTWTHSWLPAGPFLDPFSGIACPDADHCVGSVFVSNGAAQDSPSGRKEGMITSSDGGETWTSAPVLNGEPGIILQIGCPSVLQCWATGGTMPVGEESSPTAGSIVATSDGGVTWASVPLPSNIDLVAGISCPTASACIALGEVRGADGKVTLEVLSDSAAPK